MLKTKTSRNKKNNKPLLINNLTLTIIFKIENIVIFTNKYPNNQEFLRAKREDCSLFRSKFVCNSTDIKPIAHARMVSCNTRGCSIQKQYPKN